MKPKAILFDLDGTLIDRQASIGKYAELFIEDFASELRESNQTQVEAILIEADGHGYRSAQRPFDIAEKLLTASGPEIANQHWRTHFPGLAVIAEGAIEVLLALKESGITLGLITNGSTSAQTSKLEALKLTPYFSTISISESFEFEKPDPRIFEATLKALACDAKDSWFVGDHPINDVWGAEQIGMKGFLLPGVDWPEGQKTCGVEIDNLRSLLEKIGHH